ncbi:hypothetical protein HY003_04265 [Candidatus Saccharibacteria bacterium]|nr:hypothetical protein [Candidatus Saccharibacteria bacterium]MBI3338483.1 hypothetical protein [Candidatus Saccharibacteria bacterium]
MENPKTVIAEHIKQATNVLVTVSSSPSVDQLSAAIGLTLVLNKLGKHATAVFSGEIPSTIEFLQPEKTIEKTTDSLRDFIIALDKSKADKLRYKVEDKLVKIFITPYHTSISDKDLEFSQGDFNVDLVLALGVHKREDLDQAITAHGRILHDATVVSINTQAVGDLGSINWVEASASSLCEMMAGLSEFVKMGLFDAQISTAFLTGIVAETKRFSNAKTTSETMSMSAKLMATGANQQLVATKLQEKTLPSGNTGLSSDVAPEPKSGANGSLNINHETNTSPIEQIHIDEQGTMHLADKIPPITPPVTPQPMAPPSADTNSRTVITEPPTLGGQLTANAEPEALDPSVDMLSLPAVDTPLLSHNSDLTVAQPNEASLPTLSASERVVMPLTPAVDASAKDSSIDKSLTTVEQTVSPESPIVDKITPPTPPVSNTIDIDDARNAVQRAVEGSTTELLQPIASLNAQPMDLDLGHSEPAQLAPTMPPSPSADPLQVAMPSKNITDSSDLSNLNLPIPTPTTNSNPPPSNMFVPPDNRQSVDNTAITVENPIAPPPVPPPMMPSVFNMPNTDNDAQTSSIPPLL